MTPRWPNRLAPLVARPGVWHVVQVCHAQGTASSTAIASAAGDGAFLERVVSGFAGLVVAGFLAGGALHLVSEARKVRDRARGWRP